MSTTNITPAPRADNPDALTRAVTSFGTFAELVDEPGYFPTLAGEDYEEQTLADAYDAAQVARGDARRAYRGAVTL